MSFVQPDYGDLFRPHTSAKAIGDPPQSPAPVRLAVGIIMLTTLSFCLLLDENLIKFILVKKLLVAVSGASFRLSKELIGFE
jgi:hypothetical protein